MRLIDADNLITDLKKLESEYLYADGNITEYDFVYGALTGVRQAITYTKNTTAIDVVSSNEWISVEDRLPEKFTNVLCLYPSKSYGSNIVVDYMESDRGYFAEQFRYGEPTHWMPLPTPPTEKEN